MRGILKKIADNEVTLEDVKSMTSQQFRLFAYMRLRSLSSKLNLVITLLVALLAAVLGLKAV